MPLPRGEKPASSTSGTSWTAARPSPSTTTGHAHRGHAAQATPATRRAAARAAAGRPPSGTRRSRPGSAGRSPASASAGSARPCPAPAAASTSSAAALASRRLRRRALDQRQHDRQPAGGAHDVLVVDLRLQEIAEREDHARPAAALAYGRRHSCAPARTCRPPRSTGAAAQHDERAIGRQHQQRQQRRRIRQADLAVGEDRVAAEDLRRPQRQLALVQPLRRPSSSAGSRRRSCRARTRRRRPAGRRPSDRLTTSSRPAIHSQRFARRRGQPPRRAAPGGGSVRRSRRAGSALRRTGVHGACEIVGLLTMTETPGAATPTDIELDSGGRRLRFAWGDGRRSDYDWEYLRWRCPCATCSGEGEYPGRAAGPHRAAAEETEMVDLELSAATRSSRPGATATTRACSRFATCAALAEKRQVYFT